MPDAMSPMLRRLMFGLALVVNLAAWLFILRTVILPLVSD
ncbi:hypothetical protein BH11PSE1_BH11PSE1_33460 [soil metagenome]